jgi:sigma-B regulation protein RsbU (phosphoserine phosphatase)
MNASTSGAAAVGDGASSDRVRVLLIDDQAIIGEAVRRMLAPEADVDFLYCADPTAAIQTAIDYKPTVILQDLVMPDIDGLTLLKSFRANPATHEVPMIVLSTKEEPKTKAEAFTLGAHDYLVKLPNPIELIARIRHHSQGYVARLQRNEAYAALQKSERALAAELSDAAKYVISLLPPPVQGEVSTDWRFVPSVQLGGDAFGYHWIDEDHFAIYLLDVCGHGVKSALLSISAMNTVRNHTLAATDFHDPNQVLSGMNNAFQMDRHNGLYFTMWYGVYNKRQRRITFASGGHPPAILLPPASSPATVDLLGKPGMVIGGLPDQEFTLDTRHVEPGSTLYVFSDGIYEVERPDGSMPTLEEFGQIVVGAPVAEGSKVETTLDAIRALHGSDQFDDDVSIVEIRF